MLTVLKYALRDLFLDLKYDFKYEKLLVINWFFLIGLVSGINYTLKGTFVGKVRFLGKYVDYLTFIIIVWFTTNAIGDAIYTSSHFSIRREDIFTHPLSRLIRSVLWNGVAHISRVLNSILIFILFGILGLDLKYIPLLIFSYFYVLFLSFPYFFFLNSIGLRIKGRDFYEVVNFVGNLFYTIFPVSYSFIELFMRYNLDIRILYLIPSLIYIEGLRILYFFGNVKFYLKVLLISFVETFILLMVSIKVFERLFEKARKMGVIKLV